MKDTIKTKLMISLGSCAIMQIFLGVWSIIPLIIIIAVIGWIPVPERKKKLYLTPFDKKMITLISTLRFPLESQFIPLDERIEFKLYSNGYMKLFIEGRSVYGWQLNDDISNSMFKITKIP